MKDSTNENISTLLNNSHEYHSNILNLRASINAMKAWQTHTDKECRMCVEDRQREGVLKDSSHWRILTDKCKNEGCSQYIIRARISS